MAIKTYKVNLEELNIAASYFLDFNRIRGSEFKHDSWVGKLGQTRSTYFKCNEQSAVDFTKS